MREIKFRAWHKAEKIMCKVNIINLNTGAFLVGVQRGIDQWVDDKTVAMAPNDGRFCDWDEIELMQSTGLKDKNGIDLGWWEGDLFNVYATIRKIVFEDGCYWFKAVFPYKVVHQKLVCINVINGSDILPEKLGNVHENPKLIEEKK